MNEMKYCFILINDRFNRLNQDCVRKAVNYCSTLSYKYRIKFMPFLYEGVQAKVSYPQANLNQT